ncbi:MAG: winged helix-turn-helix domain-containing protein, partial [Streptomyces sp.]|nr:winged helix-turn-helix domain-containing protein [Streptomyces sp.]
MPSEGERAGGGSGLDRFSGVLARARAGVPPTPVELAEVLWLAQHVTPGAAEPTAPAPPSGPPGAPAESPPASPPTPSPSPREPRVPLRLPDRTPPGAAPEPPAATTPHTRLLAPAPPMLSRPLALQRALRPLKRPVPSPHGQELDEEATAHRIARLGARPEWWLPVLRPTTERWLRLRLVYDAGPTMPVWRPLVRELHTVLAQSGVFRTVELHRADADGGVRPGVHPAADGRTVALLVSDCMGPQWWEGAAGARWYGTLRHWAQHMPLAVVQPLPERLWRDTALPTTAGLFSAPAPAAPTAGLSFTPYSSAADAEFLALPVMEPAAPWLAHWSALVADPGAARLPGAAALLPRRPAATPPGDERARGDVTRLSAEELVLRFRSTASPEAFRLAGHLAVGEPHLPVMRLVQAAVEPHPRPQHLAEVILSGMLTSTAPGRYAFRPGVRELLLRTLPRTALGRTTELLARAGALIDARAGVTAGEFRAVAPRAAEGGGERAEGDPIALVREGSVRQLSGPEPEAELVAGRYLLREPLGRSGALWLASDVREKGLTVVVRRLRTRGTRQAADFLAAARALDGLRHRHELVVNVEDYGVDEETGEAHLVTEYVEGGSLRDLLMAHDGRLPADVLLDLAPQLATTVAAVHAGGVSHGALSPSYVRFAVRGPVLCGFALRAHTLDSRKTDLQALGRLVRELWLGSAPESSPALMEGPADLPEHIRTELRSAVNDLLSGSHTLQQRGLDRLAHLGPTSADLRFSFLGPLRITRAGRPVATGSPQEQAVLWMLLRTPGRHVRRTELASGLWGTRQPNDAHRLLGTYASQIRNALGSGVLVTEADGYRLRLGSGDVDVHHVEEITGGGSRFTRRMAESALRLWRGEPLEGIPGPAAEADRARLNELRSTLRDAASPAHTSVLVELVDTEQEETHQALGRAVARLIEVSGAGEEEAELLPHPDGYQVLVGTGSAAQRLLTAVVRQLADTVWELVPGLPRLLVTVWPAGSDRQDAPRGLRGLLDGFGADIVLGVSHPLYIGLSSTSELGLRPSGPTPTHWYTLLRASRDTFGQEHPVRGPLPLPGEERNPQKVLVHVGPDAVPTLDAPDGPASGWRYYEVDLVERSIFVGPSPRAWAAVRVVDPVEAVRHADEDLREQLAEQLAQESSRLPRPLDTEKLERRLTRWKLPGYAVRWTVSP